MEKETYGKVTVGYGTTDERKLSITGFVRAKYDDDRVISICEVEDGTLVGSVENPHSSGRHTQTSIYLTKESFVGLLATAMLYFGIQGEDIRKLSANIMQGDDVAYSYSKNLEDKLKQRVGE